MPLRCFALPCLCNPARWLSMSCLSLAERFPANRVLAWPLPRIAVHCRCFSRQSMLRSSAARRRFAPASLSRPLPSHCWLCLASHCRRLACRSLPWYAMPSRSKPRFATAQQCLSEPPPILAVVAKPLPIGRSLAAAARFEAAFAGRFVAIASHSSGLLSHRVVLRFSSMHSHCAARSSMPFARGRCAIAGCGLAVLGRCISARFIALPLRCLSTIAQPSQSWA